MYLVLKLCCIIMDIVNTEQLSRSSVLIGQNYTIKLTCQCSPCYKRKKKLLFFFVFQSVNITSQKKKKLKKQELDSWESGGGCLLGFYRAKLSPVSMRFTSTILYFSSVQLFALFFLFFFLRSVVGVYNQLLFTFLSFQHNACLRCSKKKKNTVAKFKN